MKLAESCISVTIKINTNRSLSIAIGITSQVVHLEKDEIWVQIVNC